MGQCLLWEGAVMGQLGHLGPRDPNQPVVAWPGHSLRNHHRPPPLTLQPRRCQEPWCGSAQVRPALRQEEGGRGSGLVPLGLLPLLAGCGPGCQSQNRRVRVERSCWHGQALTFSPFQWPGPASLGRQEGPGSQEPRVRISPLPEPAAGCHLGRGSASFPNLPSLWKRGRELCAEKIASPSILRLSVKNPTKPAFAIKGRDGSATCWAVSKGIFFSWGLDIHEKSLFALHFLWLLHFIS